MSKVSNIIMGTGVVLSTIAPIQKTVAQNASKLNAKPAAGMLHEVGDRVILTYSGKGKKMNVDKGASEYSVKRRLFGWGFEDALMMPVKKLNKFIKKADTNAPKGVVTVSEFKKAGVDLSADSRLAKTILFIESLDKGKTPVESYLDVTETLDSIAAINRTDATMIADDPVIRSLTNQSRLGPTIATQK